MLKILMSVAFYPRGGSAHVARYLSRALIDAGHQVHLVTGSLNDGDPEHSAAVFYTGIPHTAVDYTEAWLAFTRGENPHSSELDVPFHPSYEDKPGVADRVFYKINRDEQRGMLRCWRDVFADLGHRFQPDVIHLHHINHMHVAASEALPRVPKAAQFHGTELRMLENMQRKPPTGGDKHLRDFWRGVMVESVAAMDHCFAISAEVHRRAQAEFSIADSRITTIPNGVNVSVFKPVSWSARAKLGFLNKILVEDPRGWDESCRPGSVAYSAQEVERFTGASGGLKPLVLFVGRFLDVKRVPLLLEAVAEANRRSGSPEDPPFNLLVWGGMPGEWEGRHPYQVARELNLPNVFFCGWLPHDLLSQGLNLADLLVVPSYHEPFGQVLLEAMAVRVPVLATRSGGPLDFVVDSGSAANGWFCDVDDVASLAETMLAALADQTELRRRGQKALDLTRARYDWNSIAQLYLDVYETLADQG